MALSPDPSKILPARASGWALAVGLIAIAIAAPQATASTASADVELRYTADPGEPNDVTVSLTGAEYTISDPGASITADPGCTTVTTSVVTCDATDVVSETFRLDDGDDRLDARGVAFAPRFPPAPFAVHGGPGNDSLQAGDGDFLLAGEEGDDRLEGGAGFDSLHGGTSDLFDQTFVVDGDDTLVGNAGSDVLDGGPGFDSLAGGPGDDTLFGKHPLAAGADGGDSLEGGDGLDSLDGSEGDDSLDGGEGDDPQITGGGGNDELAGGGGDDFSLNGGPGDDRLDGGEGNDQALDGGPGDDRLDGGGGNDQVISGGVGNDELDGGRGDDQLLGGCLFSCEADGDDVLSGGDGKDVLAGSEGNDRLDGGAGDDALEPEEVLTGLGRGDDVVNGGPGDDTFTAGSTCVGLFCPADSGVPARDTFNGGEGRDTVDYRRLVASLTVTLDGRPDDGPVGANASNIGPDVEVVLAGPQGDTLIGGDADNEIDGGDGDDLIVGGAGNDTLKGGATDSGSDTLEGGPGDDRVSGGPGDDLLDGGDGGDSMGGGGGSDTLDGGSDSDSLAGGSGIDSLVGGPGNDTLEGGEPALIGADGADSLDGGEGNDALDGGPGPDLLDGGPGGDVLSGGAGRDTLTFEFRSSPVQVTLDDVANDGEAGEGDNVRSDIEAVVGGSDEDTLAGDAGTNTLDGSSGEDFVDGAAGVDSLEGGNARDTVRARDGAPDRVACGDARDFAIVDRFDTVKDCERVDRGGRHRPRARRVIVVRPTAGDLAMRLPGTDRRVPLKDTVSLPIAAALDARAGEVQVTTAGGGRRGTQTGTFSGGAFGVTQGRGPGALTEMVLRGGGTEQSQACGHPKQGGALSARHRTRVYRRVAADTHGQVAVRGRRSRARAASAGAELVVEDRCDGTLTRVRRGKVTVQVFAHGRRKAPVVVRLRAGQKYLARAPRVTR